MGRRAWRGNLLRDGFGQEPVELGHQRLLRWFVVNVQLEGCATQEAPVNPTIGAATKRLTLCMCQLYRCFPGAR